VIGPVHTLNLHSQGPKGTGTMTFDEAETPSRFSIDDITGYSDGEIDRFITMFHERFAKLNDLASTYSDRVTAYSHDESLSSQEKYTKVRLQSEFAELASEMRDDVKKKWFSCIIEQALRDL